MDLLPCILAAVSAAAPETDIRDPATNVYFKVVSTTVDNRKHNKVHHFDRIYDKISVSVCTAILRESGADQVIARVDDGRAPQQLSLSCLMSDAPTIRQIRAVQRWETKSAKAIPTLKMPVASQLAPITDDSPPLLAPFPLTSVGLASRTAESWRAMPHANQMCEIVAQLAGRSAFEGVASLNLMDLECDFDEVALRDLERMGALVTSTSSWGDLQLAVVPRALDWLLHEGIHRPCRLLDTFNEDVKKATKTELNLLLYKDGWQPSVGVLAPYKQGGERLYHQQLQKPRSYFHALVCASALFGKGIECIRHDALDKYYRTLISLEGELLRKFLAALDAGADLHEACGVLEDELALLAFEDAHDDGILSSMQGAQMPVPALEGWQRCAVHVGGDTERVKIHFDNFTGMSIGKQRGFVQCSAGCRKHVNTFGSREEFCAYYYCWVQDGLTVHLDDTLNHLSHIPAETDVAAAFANIVLEDF